MIDDPEYQVLWEEVKNCFKKFIYVMDYRHYDLLTAFVMASYIQRTTLEVCPYLQLVGGYNTGKTTCLKTLEQLCCNPYRFISETPAVIFRVIDMSYPVTSLIDEAGHYDQEYKAAILDILNAGNDMTAAVTRTFKQDSHGDYEPRKYRIGGMKVFAGYFYFAQALGSRCIKITMRRPSDTSFRREDKDEIRDYCGPIRTRIEIFFKNKKGIHLFKSKSLFAGNDRVYDIFRGLITVAPSDKVVGILVQLGKIMFKEEKVEEGESPEVVIARKIIDLARSNMLNNGGYVSPRDVVEEIKRDEPETKITSQKVGWAAKKLGLEKIEGTSHKLYIIYDEEKLSQYDGVGKSNSPLRGVTIGSSDHPEHLIWWFRRIEREIEHDPEHRRLKSL